MKKLHLGIFLLVLTGIVFTFTSCEQDTTEEELFKEQLLLGKWNDGEGDNQNFTIDASKIGKPIFPGSTQNDDVFDTDHIGYTWDTSDDVTEDDAQVFTWKLTIDGALTEIHLLEMGGKVPKTYTVTVLTSEELIYEDNYGKEHKYSRN